MMLIQIRQQIQLKHDIRAFREVYKEFESNCIPHKGDFISDPAFKEPYEYEVIETTIDYNNETCYVAIKPFVIESEKATKDDVIDYVKMMMLHGWKSIGLND